MKNYKEEFKHIDLMAESERTDIKQAADEQIKDIYIGAKLISKDDATKQNLNKMFVKNTTQILSEVEKKMSEIVKNVCGAFVADYTIELFPDDGKDHTADRNIAITMINSLGENLDVETLKELLIPLRYDKQGFALAKKLVMSKNYSDVLELHRAFDEVIGISGYIEILADYDSSLQQIKGMEENTGRPYTYTAETTNNDLEVVVEVRKSYSMLALPTVLNEIMGMYNIISKNIPELHLEEKPFEPVESELGGQ